MRWRGIFRCRSAVGGVRRSSQPLCPIARDARAFPPSPSKAQLVSDEAHVWSCVLPDEGKGGGCLGPGACRNPQVAQAWARSSSRGSPLACPRRPAPRSRCPRRRNSAASARSSVISFPREDRRVGRHEGPREVARLAGVVGMFSSPISATTVVRTWALAELLGTILGSPRCGVGSSIAKLSRSRYEPNRHTPFAKAIVFNTHRPPLRFWLPSAGTCRFGPQASPFPSFNVVGASRGNIGHLLDFLSGGVLLWRMST